MKVRRVLRSILALAPLALLQPVVLCRAAASPTLASLSAPQYISELDRCLAVVRLPRHDAAGLHALRVSLPAKWVVQAGGQSYQISTGWLVENLAEAESNPAKAASILSETAEKLDAYRWAAASMDARGAQSLPESRMKLNRILNSKEFQAMRGPSWFDLLRQRFSSWLFRQVEKLLGLLRVRRAFSSALAWIVIILAALLLVLWAVRASIAARPEMDLHGASAIGKSSRDWLGEAQDAAGRGDYRAAIQASYWTAVARLNETSCLPEDRSRTPRESLRLIEPDRAEYAPLAHLTRRFELVWYGYRSASAADWSEALQQLGRLGCLRSSTAAISAS